MAKATRKNRTGPLEIAVGWQGDGGVYEIQPWDEDRIREAFPEAIIIPGMLVGYDKSEDYERFHGRYWQQIALMLTGLTPEQIARLGGIRIWDPEAEKVLWEWHPDPVMAPR
jgi:hypothetical protein